MRLITCSFSVFTSDSIEHVRKLTKHEMRKLTLFSVSSADAVPNNNNDLTSVFSNKQFALSFDTVNKFKLKIVGLINHLNNDSDIFN